MLVVTRKMTDAIYQTLATGTKTVRLLTLQPCTEQRQPIIAALEQADLDHRPEYEAISWYWGNPPFTGSIILSGVQATVPHNLEEALKHFRFSDRPRRLWVDVICINQKDLSERETQIKLMRDIYGDATRTLVWLGPMQNRMDRVAFATLKRLCHGVSLRQTILEEAFGWPSQQQCPDEELESRLAEYEDHDFLIPLSSFFERDWWKRLWVLQEVAVASEVLLFFGYENMEFTQLTSAYERLLTELRDRQTTLQSILGISQIQSFRDLLESSINTTIQLKRIFDRIRSQEGTISQRDMCLQMIEALAKARTREASASHDKVFGLLGLIHPDLIQHFQPSYTEPGKQVFCRTAYQLLDLSKSFMLFNCLRDGSVLRPSWCPDWTYTFHQIQDFNLRAQQEPLFKAGGNTVWHLRIDSLRLHMPTLHVKGFRLDTIRRQWELGYDLLDAASLYLYLEGCLKLIIGDLLSPPLDHFSISRDAQQVHNARYITGVGILEAVTRVALNDCEPYSGNGSIRRLRIDNARRFEQWLATIDEEQGLSNYRQEAIDSSEAISFAEVERPSMCEFARSVIKGKQFFTTKLGFAGLLDYENCDENDEVWILAGGSQPVILRPEPSQSGCYYVCSEAYVHGVMDGEAVQGEVPILPKDGNSEGVVLDLQKGRKTWPQPQFRSIKLL